MIWPERWHVFEGLTEACFRDAANRAAWRTLVKMKETGKAFATVLIVTGLVQEGVCKSDVDAETFIVSCQDDAPKKDGEIDSVVETLLDFGAHTAVEALGGEIAALGRTPELDGDALAAEVERVVSATTKRLVRPRSRSLMEICEDEIVRVTSDVRGPTGLRTNLHPFDDFTGGLKAGEVIVVAGRPSMGKTQFMCQGALQLAKQQPGLIVSMEMTEIALVQRMVCSMAGVNIRRCQDNAFSPDERMRYIEALQRFRELPIFIDHGAGVTAARIVATATRLHAEHGIGWVAIDYAQRMDMRQQKNETRDSAIGRMSNRIKDLALDLNIAVMLLAQLNRSPDGRVNNRPQMSDLRESGNLEQDADMIVLMFREAYYRLQKGEIHRAPDHERLDLIITKQRNGATGDVSVGWKGAIGRIVENPPDGP